VELVFGVDAVLLEDPLPQALRPSTITGPSTATVSVVVRVLALERDILFSFDSPSKQE